MSRVRAQAARAHQRINVAEVLQLLLGQRDERGNDRVPVRVLDDQTHGERRGLAFAVGVVAQELIEVVQDDMDPFGRCRALEID